MRALVLASDEVAPDPPPAAWDTVPAAPFVPFEDAAPGSLPLQVDGRDAGRPLRIEERSASLVAITIDGTTAEVPRYWLARMLFRVALHGLRLGYAETYGGFFADDRGEDVRLGLRGEKGRAPVAVTFTRSDALEIVERMYRAVAPSGYRERPA